MNKIIFFLLVLFSSVAHADIVTISGTPPSTVAVNTSYSFRPTASSNNKGAKISFSITNKPSWATFNTVTGQLSGTANQLGLYANIVITARSNKGGVASLVPFSITVFQPNRPPIITSVSSKTNNIGDYVGFQIYASDADGDLITYSSSGLPIGITINSSSGYVSGTASTVGNYSSTIRATDSKGASSSTTFSWSVVQPNRPPTISTISNKSNVLGDFVSIQVYGSDPDGNTLTYSASGLPTGLLISSSGLISGQLSYIGMFYVTITVTDTSGATGSTSFYWDVASPPPLNTAVLSWTPPTQNTDGSPLTDLAGYKIFYSQDPSNITTYTITVYVGVSSAEISNLMNGTWYFAMKSFNSSNVESDITPLVSKTF